MRKDDRNIVLEFRSSQKSYDRSRMVFAKICPVQEIILITIKIRRLEPSFICRRRLLFTTAVFPTVGWV